MKADDLFLLFLPKKFFLFVLGVVHNDPFSTGFQHKLLILIVSSNIFHWKSVKESKVGVVFGAKFGPN